MRNANFTIAGGFPFEQDTLKFMQDEYQDIQKLLKAFFQVPDSGNYILAGLKPTGTPDQYEEGWISIDGEIIHVAAGTGVKFNVVTTTTQKTYEDTNDHDVYVYKAATIHASTGTDISSFTSVPLYQQSTEGVLGLVRLASASEVAALSDATKAITPAKLNSGLKGNKDQTGWPYSTLHASFGRLGGGSAWIQYWKDQFKQVRLTGDVIKCTDVSGAAANTVLFTLNSSHRLFTNQYVKDEIVFVVPRRSTSFSYNPVKVAHIKVKANGEVVLLDAVTQDDTLDLRSICFPAST